MTPTELVEKTARAIREVGGAPFVTPLPGGRQSVAVMVDPEVAARSAILAVLEEIAEPSIAMIMAGDTAMVEARFTDAEWAKKTGEAPNISSKPKAAWKAMIQALIASMGETK